MIIAIDPGKNGGIAWSSHGLASCSKMPSGLSALFSFLMDLKSSANGDKIVCLLEEVHSMPKQGVKAVWTFAEHVGSLKALLYAAGIPVTPVPPITWQKAIGASRPSTPHGASPSVRDRIKHDGKLKIKNLVEAHFPSLTVTFATSDALGILFYGEKEYPHES